MNDYERRYIAEAAESARLARFWTVEVGDEDEVVKADKIPEDFLTCAKAVPVLLAEVEEWRRMHGEAIAELGGTAECVQLCKDTVDEVGAVNKQLIDAVALVRSQLLELHADSLHIPERAAAFAAAVRVLDAAGGDS